MLPARAFAVKTTAFGHLRGRLLPDVVVHLNCDGAGERVIVLTYDGSD